jgi:hypothetical protein
MPWRANDDDVSFQRVTERLRVSADVAYAVRAPITEECDHSDAPEGEDVVCDATNIYVRAVFGRVLITVGNGSMRSIDYASTPRAAQEMAHEACAALVHLEGFEQLTGPTLEYPSEETVALHKEAQVIRAAQKAAEAKARQMAEDPKLMREIGLEMLKRAKSLGDTSDEEDSTGIGQYV